MDLYVTVGERNGKLCLLSIQAPGCDPDFVDAVAKKMVGMVDEVCRPGMSDEPTGTSQTD
jgi:hypothetical protein